MSLLSPRKSKIYNNISKVCNQAIVYLLPRNGDSSFPTKYVGIEAEMVGGDEDPSMNKNVFL